MYILRSLRVFTPLLVCYSNVLSAQQADTDTVSTPPDTSVSTADSSIAVSASDSSPALVYTPLDLRQKYFYSLNEMAGPSQWIGFAVHAALDQARKTPDAWGNGAGSFGVRMANHFGITFLRENIAFGVRAFDREDPRYFRMEKGTAWNRAKYAMTRTFIARKDDGGWMPAYSRLTADVATPFLAQAWRPDKFTMGRGFRGGSANIGISMGSNVWREFWPDLKKKVWKNSKRFPQTEQWWMPMWLSTPNP
jgi:hypothetical protein